MIILFLVGKQIHRIESIRFSVVVVIGVGNFHHLASKGRLGNGSGTTFSLSGQRTLPVAAVPGITIFDVGETIVQEHHLSTLGVTELSCPKARGIYNGKTRHHFGAIHC